MGFGLTCASDSDSRLSMPSVVLDCLESGAAAVGGVGQYEVFPLLRVSRGNSRSRSLCAVGGLVVGVLGASATGCK